MRRCLGMLPGAIAILLMAIPCSAQPFLYVGNFHSHSNLSDDATGPESGPPGAAFQYARDVAGIDVLALTDHTHYMSASEYSFLQSQADVWTTNGSFVALAAQEHGSLSSSVTGAFGHMNTWEAAVRVDQTLYRYNLPGTYQWLATNVDDTAGLPLSAGFNHPYSSAGAGQWAQFQNFTFDPVADSAMRHIEMLNGKRTSDYEPQFLEALLKGWHVGVLGNQDNHQGGWGDQPNNADKIPLTGIWADDLTKADILEALRERRTFAMEVAPATDRISLKLVADGTHWMGGEFATAADSITFDVEVSAENTIVSLQLYRNGTFIKSTGVGSTSFTWNTFDTPGPGDFYYFVKMTQTDGDRAWTSPIWVESTSSFSLPISAIRQNEADGSPSLWFQTVTTQGIVTVETGALHPSDNKVFIQDPTGGTMILDTGTQTPNLQRGDNVLVTGEVDTIAGQTALVGPSAIEIQSTGGAPPDPLVITTVEADTNGETHEGSLMEIREVSIVSGTWPVPGDDGSVIIDDGTGPATLFIDRHTDLDEAGPPADSVFSVRGIVTQRDLNAPPYDCCHVLMPRDAADIFQLQGLGVSELPSHGPARVSELQPASPNPFSATTRIRFELAGTADQTVQLAIYDVRGRRIRTLVDVRLAPGTFEAEWDGLDETGRRTAAGVYFSRLVTRDTDLSRKIIRLR